MPTYEYQCEACEHEFEHYQSITAKPLRKCPECGKNKLKRLIGTGAGVIFKGSGFWQTDYRSDSYQKQAKAEKEAASPSSDKGAKSDKSEKSEKSEKSSPKSEAATSAKAPATTSSDKPAAKGTSKRSKKSEN